MPCRVRMIFFLACSVINVFGCSREMIRNFISSKKCLVTWKTLRKGYWTSWEIMNHKPDLQRVDIAVKILRFNYFQSCPLLRACLNVAPLFYIQFCVLGVAATAGRDCLRKYWDGRHDFGNVRLLFSFNSTQKSNGTSWIGPRMYAVAGMFVSARKFRSLPMIICP